MHRRRAEFARDLIRRIGSQLSPDELLRLRANVVEATRNAVLLYPTNATLHGELAEASEELGVISDAVREAREALRLDRLTPHLDKKLPEAMRRRLETKLPEWEKMTSPQPDS